MTDNLISWPLILPGDEPSGSKLGRIVKVNQFILSPVSGSGDDFNFIQ